ncbi:histidine kinase [Streptacidiphilus sp. PB12-B1b]|uniref:sensor histidine kinase n=1 Tax=Streptacidiphilus sp. PB12-B1b TaxID=2705012 RepID=UPI0015FA596A|nr:sensor histidine kinase [Streptacidiphilus sp. PB12-B1b]QMU77221.1 histidine kinase [Streptacidiphilus sp. PB12-B1b]
MPQQDALPTVGWSTRQWLALGIGTAVGLLAVLSAVAVWTLQHSTDVSNRLVDQTSPALVAAVQLEAAMINQETGTRGYGLTGQADFLQPYTEGLSQEQTAVRQLRSLAAGPQGRSDLALVLDRAALWQQRVAAPIAASPPGTPPLIAAQRADEGKELFDSLRTAMTDQQTHLEQARSHDRADLGHVRALRNRIFSAIGAILLLNFLLVFEGLRRGVTMPLAALRRDTRQVTAGDFGHPVNPTGPSDLRALAADVESMRLRLLQELRASDHARALLDTQATELQRSNGELEQFAYVASHDLQEPLRKIASFCQLLQRRYGGQLDAKADQYIAYAVDGAERMQKLITDLLTFSRVGRVNTEITQVDLEDSLSRALDNLEVTISETAAEITHDPLPTVAGDPTLLTLLLQNLVSNAVKFRSPQRPPRVHLSAERDGGVWRLAVTDNGIGIGPEFAERVFLIFQRLHTKDAYPGSGIGLAMCRKIVEFHGGTIRTDTAPRDGTRMEFTLPAAD